MVPLEVTHTALASPAVLQRMFHKGSAVSISPFKAMVELLLTFFEQTYRCGAWLINAVHEYSPIHSTPVVVPPSSIKARKPLCMAVAHGA